MRVGKVDRSCLFLLMTLCKLASLTNIYSAGEKIRQSRADYLDMFILLGCMQTHS